MKKLLSVVTLAIGLTCLFPTNTAPGQAPEATWEKLFDGESLRGWDHDPNHWRVEAGAIVGEIPQGQSLRHNTWIVWKGEPVADFELRLQFRLGGAPAANSGIQFRCQVEDVNHVSGYQADLDMGATWLGRIYDEHGRALLVERGRRVEIDADGRRKESVFAPANQYQVLYREGRWNDYRIVAIGPRVTVTVNGTLFAELIDHQRGEADLSGGLAFQLHSGPTTKIEFRDVRLQRLGGGDDRQGPMPVFESPEVPDSPGIAAVDAEGRELNLGFESGDLSDWEATGDAFRGQPVATDGIASRWPGQSSGKRGTHFIGGFEIARDAGKGTLTSIAFPVNQPYASFLFGGGDSAQTRAEIVVAGAKGEGETQIFSAVGDRREQMRRHVVDLRGHQGESIRIRLVDTSAGAWGHLNFDDFRFHKESPTFADDSGRTGQWRNRHNPLLHHLVDNPATVSGTSADATVKQMYVPDGFSVDVVACEPDLHQPMAFTFDAKGRLWVVEGHSYPTKRPEGQGLDKILIFTDTDKDGRYDRRQVFTEGLNLVSGMQVGHGGVWVGAAPELLFIPDRDGDDRPDGDPIVLLDGFGFADTHETLNSFVWGPDGWLYGNQGVFNASRIGKPQSSAEDRVALSAGVWRYHPTQHRFEVFAHGGSNQWGLDFDDHGQLFMTHCRSAWGKGATTHVVQGGHYWNQVNGGHAPFISSRPVAGIAAMKNFMLASARYGHGEGGAGKRGSRQVYGGHSHVGTMIYLGDNWPDRYRNHLFTHNLHGHQINQQINRRLAGGYDTVHAGSDVFFCADRQYVGVDLQVGPDGAVYLSDWYDPRHCHNPNAEQWDRGNGRIYRMRYDSTFLPASVDYTSADDLDLAKAQRHHNDWHVRQARLLLAERAARRDVSRDAITYLREMTRAPDPESRLRAVWALHAARDLNPETIRTLIDDDSEYVRAWAVRLATEIRSGPVVDTILAKLAKSERSLFVRRHLASASAFLADAAAWDVLETLSAQAENASDRDLPLMIWYAIAQRMPHNLDRCLAQLDTTELDTVRDGILWYAPQTSVAARDAILKRLATTAPEAKKRTLQLLSDGLLGSRGIEQPASWAGIADALYQSSDTAVRRSAESLGAVFSDQALFTRIRQRLAEANDVTVKRDALRILAFDSSPENVPLLLGLLRSPELAADVIGQLKNYDDPRVGETLVRHIPKWSGRELDSAMEAICGRVEPSLLLLDAIDEGAVAAERLTAFYVRQMSMLGDKRLTERLVKRWGRLNQSSEEKRAEIKNVAAAYSAAPLWAFDQNAGQALFRKHCANCHVASEGQPRVGPKLEGSGSKGIEYIVENIVDPNAVIGKDFQARLVLTGDGRVITGVITGETDSAVTVRTTTGTETIAQDEIEEIRVSENSFMPEGLLQPLSDRERIELLKYLMSLR